MDCESCLEIVSAVLDAEAAADERRAADAHLATCTECTLAATAMHAHARALRLRSPVAAPDMTASILAAADTRPHRRSRLLVGVAAAAAVAAVIGAAVILDSDDRSGPARSLTVQDARASAGRNGGVSEVYFYVTNEGAADRVVAVTTSRADLAQIHVTETTDGIETMRTVGSLPLPADSSARLGPRGVHVMLVGLRGDVEPGDSVPLTLVLERGGVVSVSAVVDEPMTS